jgi:hypothetical protein
MRVNRGVFGVVGVLAAASVAVLAAVGAWWYQRGEIDPRTANHEELFRWLVTHDLKGVSPQIRRYAAERLDEEFDEEIDWEALARQLTARHREQLWRNIPLVLEPWFMDKVDRYCASADTERMTVLDQTIDTMWLWSGLDKLGPEGTVKGESAGTPAGLKDMLLEEVKRWRSRVDRVEQDHIDEFMAALETRWLFRRLAEQFRGGEK